MSFCLKRRESVADGWHRIVHEEYDAVESSIRALRNSYTATESVHDARKHLKRLRALYQLCREPLGRELCAKEVSNLRDLARVLSAERDVEVRVATLEMLLHECKLTDNTNVRKLLQSWQRQRDRLMKEAARPASVRGLVESISAARQRLDRFEILEGGWRLVSHALARSYRRARKGLRAAAEQPQEDELLHEWRKCVKVFEYQFAVLRKMHRNVPPMTRRVHQLTESLGEEHDLFVLLTALEGSQPEFLNTAPGRRLLAMIEKRRVTLRRRSLRLGKTFFAERPRSFVERLHGWWREWR